MCFPVLYKKFEQLLYLTAFKKILKIYAKDQHTPGSSLH
jgi:hypothetical protein